MAKIEEWKQIPNYENYEVSTSGKVRSTDRLISRKDGSTHFWKGKSILLSKNTSGYWQVGMTNKKGIKKTLVVHRLMGLAFMPFGDKVDFQINHIDGNKENNNIENLEWCSRQENIAHAVRIGLMKKGGDLPYSKLVLDNETGIFYESMSEAAIAKGIKNRTLSHWLLGDRKNKSSLVLV